MTRWVEGAFIVLLLSFAPSRCRGTSILPRAAVACKRTLSLCCKGVNPQPSRLRAGAWYRTVRCASVRKAESRIGAGFTPMLPCGQDLGRSGVSGRPGREETHFGERTQHVDNGCV